MPATRLTPGPAGDHSPHLVSGLAHPKLLNERVVSQRAYDVLERPEVIGRLVLGRNEQEKHVNRFTVEAVERNPGRRQSDRSYQLTDRRVAGMGNGDPAADPRGAKPFPA